MSDPPIEVSSASSIQEKPIEEVLLDLGGKSLCGMTVVRPCATYISRGVADLPGSEAAVGRSVGMVLNTLATVLSCWYLEMRDAVSRGRDMQRKERALRGLSKHAKVPWVHPGFTPKNLSVSAAMETVVEAMFGKELSSYAADRYRHAVDTGDMRSFKLRLLMLRARDLLKDTPLYDPFRSGVNEAITFAENRAGCIPCPGPRRMSRAEQEKKRMRDGLSPVTVPKSEIITQKDNIKSKQASNHKKERKSPKIITDDELAERVRDGDISPGKALLMMLNNESKATSNPPISKNKPIGTVPNLTGTVPEKKKRPGTVPETGSLSPDELKKMADDILRQEYGTTFDEDDSRNGEEEMNEDLEEPSRNCGGGYRGGGYGYGYGYGKYKASGAEWCPDDD